MSKNVKTVETKPVDSLVAKVLVEAEETGLTLEQINAELDEPIVSGTMNGVVKRGYAEPIGVEKVAVPTTKTLASYKFVSDAVMTKADGKPYNYSDNEKKILETMKGHEENLSNPEVAALMGVDGNLASAYFTNLVKKGNLVKGELKTVPTVKTKEVNLYAITEKGKTLVK